MDKRTETQRLHNLGQPPRFDRMDHWHRLLFEAIACMRDYLDGEEPIEQVERSLDDLKAEVLQMPHALRDAVSATVELGQKIRKEE